MAKTHIEGPNGFALCGLRTREGELRNYDYGTRDVNNVTLVQVSFQYELGFIKSPCNECYTKALKNFDYEGGN